MDAFNEIQGDYPARIFQGAALTAEILEALPRPLVIVNMATDVPCLSEALDDARVLEYLHLAIDDWDDPLPDDRLISAVDDIIAHLRAGRNLYVHCRMGVSRSTYFTAALHMRLFGWSMSRSVKHIAASRPAVWPNRYFVAHLQRLEPQLRSGSASFARRERTQ